MKALKSGQAVRLREPNLLNLCKQIYEEEPVAQYINLIKEANVTIEQRLGVVRAMETKIID